MKTPTAPSTPVRLSGVPTRPTSLTGQQVAETPAGPAGGIANPATQGQSGTVQAPRMVVAEISEPFKEAFDKLGADFGFEPGVIKEAWEHLSTRVVNHQKPSQP